MSNNNFKYLSCKSLALLAPILFLIQSCNTTELGQELANSFDEPITNEDSKKGIKEVKIIDSNKELKKNEKSKSNNKNIKKLSQNTIRKKRAPKLSINKSDLKIDSEPFNPRPYRIIIKLSAANPAAPAELVTQALRRAGVKFEVELIERVDNRKSIKNAPVRGINR